ncbi:MAG: adenylate/guanylate cyclase domain-containing protein [Verrucomicrobiota bacterium]
MAASGSSSSDNAGRRFDAVRAPWFFPLLVLLCWIPFRVFLPQWAEKPEKLWLDSALQIRAALGFAEPLDPRIRFVEVKMNDALAESFATKGEYQTAADLLGTISKFGVSVIALDIQYTFGLEEDQAALAKTIAEIESTSATRIVLPFRIENSFDGEAYLVRSLPDAETREGRVEPLEGAVNAEAGNHWRRYRFAHTHDGEALPSLALAAFGASQPAGLGPKPSSRSTFTWKEIDPESGKISEREVGNELFYLNLQHSYYNDMIDRESGIDQRVWTIEDLEREAPSASTFQSRLVDTIVIVGWDEQYDGRPTAHGDQEPGMVLHGTALSDLIHDTGIHRTSLPLDLAISITVALLASLFFSKARKKRLILLGAVAVVGALGLIGWLSIWFIHIFPTTVNPIFIWLSAVVLEIARRWSFEQRERIQRDAMLGFYFSPAVLKQVTQDLSMIRPRGNEVAILLSDLRGFTTLCETQPVEQVFELLNRLFGVETEVALRENGSLARFAGDQFLAYWGAPESDEEGPSEDAADRALRAAIEIQRTLRKRISTAPEGDLDRWLRIGIGLHYGKGLTGHVGSRSYRDFNIVGDSVNTTARVEGQTKNYAAPVLATGRFVSALKEPVTTLMVDHVTVKGKAKPNELHAILLEETEAILESCEAYRKAFSEYASGNFGGAAEQFSKLLEDEFETVAVSAKRLLERCRELSTTPPEAWTGVYELTSK